MVIYVVYCENCKTNEKLCETAFISEGKAIEYVNKKSREYNYIDWCYCYEAVTLRDVPDKDVGKK